MSLVFINNTEETFTPTQSGAVATILWELCRQAQLQGLEPIVITRNCAAAPYKWPRTYLVNYPRLPESVMGVTACRVERRLNGWRYFRQRAYGLRVVAAIHKYNLEAGSFVLHNDPELTVLLRYCFPNAWIVHHFHNVLECKPKFRRLFGAAVSKVCAVSSFTAHWIENYYGLSANSVKTIYSGVDADHFTPASMPPSGTPVIGYVGRTGSEKAPDLLLRAAELLSRETAQFRLQLVGSNHWDRLEVDTYQRHLSELCTVLEQRGIAIRKPGHIGRQQLPEEFRKATIHVVPTRVDESFGLTTVEGMASGLAVVASRTGGTPEVIGDAGLLFEREDVEGLYHHLRTLICNEALRREYGYRARERAETFTWERTWTQMRAVTKV